MDEIINNLERIEELKNQAFEICINILGYNPYEPEPEPEPEPGPR